MFFENIAYCFDVVEVVLLGRLLWNFGLGSEYVGVDPMSEGRDNEVVV